MFLARTVPMFCRCMSISAKVTRYQYGSGRRRVAAPQCNAIARAVYKAKLPMKPFDRYGTTHVAKTRALPRSSSLYDMYSNIPVPMRSARLSILCTREEDIGPLENADRT
jgi:hypothetical protein